ncbi:MAG TPA: UDP-glucuronic acid decarboxylase family protein [Fimbriimonadaceae bacterium]|nr:UDP-glucuronic acid decarboxylase family protein [Fimbriimonadaceae bacterium]
MRALVTGGAGFLGSHLTDLLLAKGHQVVVVDNLVTGDAANLAHLKGNANAEFLERDACLPLLDAPGPIDFVFHFASPASPVDFTRIPLEVLRVNSAGTENALELARKHGAGFMVASTSEVYGDPKESPQREEYWGNVNPNGIRSCYDEGKRYGEALTMAYRRQYGLNTHIVRFFNTYGPRMRLDDGRVVPNMVRQALEGEPITVYGSGKQTRSFGFYADIVDGVYRLSQSDFHDPVNLGSQEERTILEFAEAVQRAIGSKSEIVFLPAALDDPQQRRPDTTRAKSVLGWEPSTSLDAGLAITIEHFRQRLGR